jgi:hypothetical protein
VQQTRDRPAPGPPNGIDLDSVHLGCIAAGLSRAGYLDELAAVGFTDASVIVT